MFLDVLTKRQGYYINSSEDFYSITGGLLYILNIAILIVLFFIIGNDFVFPIDPQTYSYSLSPEVTLNWNLTGTTKFIFGMPKKYVSYFRYYEVGVGTITPPQCSKE